LSSCVSRLGFLCPFVTLHLAQVAVGDGPFYPLVVEAEPTFGIQLDLRELIGADVGAFILPKAIEKNRPLAASLFDQHAIAAALALASARHPCLTTSPPRSASTKPRRALASAEQSMGSVILSRR
jgi:hypothetical protein